ncbi:hypothetical protein BDN72DRAFT_321407 [Pluteus cervinus]|uniref:Uncharacterized protein n=1 Tax=Pluteus cervinus TaxID=181527 RepID=A0ACD3ACJ0_9AGAR|nr:hypothetical protein BDN72DRAFT_321407 [Pluteus cervinus]
MPLAPPHPIVTEQFDTSEVAIAKIDVEIAALRESIRGLHAFRNTFIPVYRLPPEVLTRIFYFVRRTPKKEMFNRKTLKWIVVTHVSQYWRYAAIECPVLWSHISGSYSKSLAQEWLHRSKTVPLFLRFCSPAMATAEQFICTSLCRIRELELEFHPGSWDEFLHKLSTPAYLLESFSLIIVGRSSQASAISDSTFAGTTPCLRHLEIAGSSVDIHSSIFTGLTSLALRYLPQTLSPTDLLITLDKLPGLASLELKNALDSESPAVSNDFNINIINLPSLESLSITGSQFIPSLDILSHIFFPENATLCFHSRAYTGERVAILSDFLRAHKAARHPESSPSLTNTIRLHTFGRTTKLCIVVDCMESAFNAELLNFELEQPTGGALEFPDSPETAILFSSLPLSSVTSFATNCGIGAGIWGDRFGPLPNLKHITASGSCASNLILAVIDDFRNSRYPAASEKKPQITSTSNLRPIDWEPIFPNLETMILCDAIFPGDTFHFVAAIQARKMAGRELNLLEIEACRNVDQEGVDALDCCVEVVTWDGWTGTVYASDDSDDLDDSDD